MSTSILVGSDEQRLWNIRNSLTDAGVEIVRQYSASNALLSAVDELDTLGDEFDLVVIDTSVEPMNAWDLTRELTSKRPSTAVTIVVDNPQPQHFSDAMDVGARGVIGYPLVYEDVAQKVASAAQWSASFRSALSRDAAGTGTQAPGTMITLSSAKGGTGSSTLALHLAMVARRAADYRSVVLVDMDLQKPDLSILLNVPQQHAITDLLAVVDELSPRQLDDVLYHSPSGYSVLFGPANGEQAELITERAAQRILGMLRSRYDLVIVDTGSVMGDGNFTAVEMADASYIVATSDVLSLRGAKRLSELWGRVGIRVESTTRVVLNRVDRKQDIQPEAAKKIVGLPVLDVNVPESHRALELAVNRRDPALSSPAWNTRISELAVEMGIAPGESLAVSPRSRSTRSKKKSQPGTRKRSADRRLKPTAQEAGQSTLEFLGIIPLFALIAVIGFQLIMVGTTWIFAAGAANEGARAAAVHSSPESAARAHVPEAWKKGLRVSQSGSTVNVSLDTPLLVPLGRTYNISIPASAGVVEEG